MRYRQILFGVSALTATRLSAQTAVPVVKAAETITVADVARHIAAIADDSMLGRATPSPGLEMTARYVADKFERFGLKPGGDKRTWFQRYRLPNDRTRTAPNVVGLLEGSDPKLKNEYIVVSAHMDHLGAGRGWLRSSLFIPGAKDNDTIFNGAYDNASGTAGVIELAQALSQPGARPRRSVLFLAVSGEEQGLWGSAYFAEHPAVSIKRIVADFNLDGIGAHGRAREWKDTVSVIGKQFSDLGATLDRVSAAHPELHLAAIDDRRPGQLFFFRSDHFSFAQRGVPILAFMEFNADPVYHRVTDSPDSVDTDKVARILRLVFHLSHEAGNANQRPKWNEVRYNQVIQRP